jgi:WD40 repeat protein
VHDLIGHQSPVYCVAYSPDGSEVTTGAQDNLLKIFDASTGEIRTTLVGHTSFIWGIGYSPDGSTLFSTGTDDLLISWDVASATMNWKITLGLGGAWSLAISSTGLVATGGQNSGIKVWNPADGSLHKEVVPTTRPGAPKQIYGLAFSPDSNLLASGGYATGDVTVWDIESAQSIGNLKGHEAYVRSVAWSPVA